MGGKVHSAVVSSRRRIGASTFGIVEGVGFAWPLFCCEFRSEPAEDDSIRGCGPGLLLAMVRDGGPFPTASLKLPTRIDSRFSAASEFDPSPAETALVLLIYSGFLSNQHLAVFIVLFPPAISKVPTIDRQTPNMEWIIAILESPMSWASIRSHRTRAPMDYSQQSMEKVPTGLTILCWDLCWEKHLSLWG